MKDHSSRRVGAKYPAVVKNESLLNDIGWGSRKSQEIGHRKQKLPRTSYKIVYVEEGEGGGKKALAPDLAIDSRRLAYASNAVVAQNGAILIFLILQYFFYLIVLRSQQELRDNRLRTLKVNKSYTKHLNKSQKEHQGSMMHA